MSGFSGFGMLVCVEGTFLGGKFYVLEVRPGVLASFYGCGVLDRGLCGVKIGDFVSITFLGVKRDLMGWEYDDYKVKVKK